MAAPMETDYVKCDHFDGQLAEHQLTRLHGNCKQTLNSGNDRLCVVW